MPLNEADIKAKLIISVLILTVGIGTLLQFLEGHKIDDEQVKTYSYSVSISQGPTSSYAGTASDSSTTTTTL